MEYDEWGGSGRIWEIGNLSQNILYEFSTKITGIQKRDL